ncbi:MAG: hypothetical protein EA418_03065, partial [Wenzhouxiangellaceae bacterium]
MPQKPCNEYASTSEISITLGPVVTYCWQVTNNTHLSLDTHNLIDSKQGVILEGSSLPLNPGQALAQPLQFDASLSNQSTWTAHNPGPVDIANDGGEDTVAFSDDVCADRFENALQAENARLGLRSSASAMSHCMRS